MLNFLTSPTLWGVVRTGAAAIGGYVAAKSGVTPDNLMTLIDSAESAVSAAAVLAAGVGSVVNKLRVNKALKVGSTQ